MAHKRLSRHEIKEDNFITTMLNAREYVLDHQNAFFVGLLAVVVVIAGVMWMSNSRDKTKENAVTQFSEALASYRMGDVKSAEEMFKLIHDRYGGLEEGAYAAYMAGKCALEEGRNTHAIEMFENYLRSSGKYPFFHDAALDGEATAWENERDYAKASEIYLRLAGDIKTNSFVEASYLRKAADALKLAQRNDEAVRVLERLLDLSTGLEKRDIEIEISILRG